MVNLALKSQRLELCHPISVLRHRFCENGVFFSSTAGLVGLTRECSAAGLDVPVKRLGRLRLSLVFSTLRRPHVQHKVDCRQQKMGPIRLRHHCVYGP
jgi:hypothetical protein